MTRLGIAGLTAVLVGTAAPVMAASSADTTAEVMRDCGGDSLPRDQVSSCLERARVLDLSDPSPELQSLEAKLEQRVRSEPRNGEANGPTAPRYGQAGADDDQPPPPPDEDYDSGNGTPGDEMSPDDQPPPDEDYGPDNQGPPDEDYGPDDDQPPAAGMWDDDEPPVDDGEDGYDNGQPDQGYDMPGDPDDDQGLPPDDEESGEQG